LQFIANLVAAIIPYLLRFMDKHSDEYLEKLSNKLINFLDSEYRATVKFCVINKEGKPLQNVEAGFCIEDIGKVYKKGEGSIITITGLREGKYEFDVLGKIIPIEIEDANVVIEKTIIMEE
jgi:hypothetical protein